MRHENRRWKNFRVWTTPVSEPELPGEMQLHYTYDGFQEHIANLSPAEAKKVMVTLANALGLKRVRFTFESAGYYCDTDGNQSGEYLSAANFTDA